MSEWPDLDFEHPEDAYDYSREQYRIQSNDRRALVVLVCIGVACLGGMLALLFVIGVI